MYWGSCHWRCLACNSNLMRNSHSHNSVTVHQIATFCCTCKDNTALVPCAKFCSYHYIRFEMKEKLNFHHIWLWWNKMSMKGTYTTFMGPIQYKNCCDISWDPVSKVEVIPINTLRPRQNGHHFTDNIFKCIFLNENVWMSIKISLMFVPKGPINGIPALVMIMAWRRSVDKPLSEPMMVSLMTHICVTRSQWVNYMNLKMSSLSKNWLPIDQPIRGLVINKKN